MILLDGKEVAKYVTKQVTEEVAKLSRKPKIVFLHLGEKAEDVSYINGAKKRMEKAGITCEDIMLPLSTGTMQLVPELQKLNGDPTVTGILLCKPLPKGVDDESASLAISIQKDMDCQNPINMGRLFMGNEVMAPCTPEAVMTILDYYKIDLSGKNVVVLGRSEIVGKPVSILALNKNATVTVCHSKTENMREITKNADVLITAMGRARAITKEYVKNGAVVIDVGINLDENGKLCGDCDFDSVSGVAGALTPVPGGVGSVVTSVLAKHVLLAEKNRLSESV